ncbi:glutathione-s-transferase [Phaffia rhodozyma]|uniref:Glutathione-s-transferase n=1 Tax=Phaffia rhodozyma TaxID=264483 RepID=A0A0F7SQA3_PHARH|nr:glutathione-s-transferase [Phaffia rhodozyma]
MPLPDAHIHPVATGKAAELVAAHKTPQDLIFHSGWFCPFNQRVWVALEEKGIEYEYREVNPYHKSKDFLAINPKGLVPAIQHHGDALYESSILLEYLDDAFPETKPLLPSDPKKKALARIDIDYFSKKVNPAWFKLLQNQDSSQEASLRADLVDALKELTGRVQGPFYSGDDFGFVDIAVAPFFARLYILEENRGFKQSEVGEKFESWVSSCVNRKSIIDSTSDKEYYAEIYERYLSNQAQSQMAKETRGEKAHT